MPSKPRIGTITIGQSPRDDILSVMQKYFTTDMDIVQIGALDGLDTAAVSHLQPDPGQPVLVSRLRDGTEVKLSHEKIFALMQNGVDILAQQKVDLIVPLCTGEFTDLHSDEVMVLHPGELLRGVLTPLTKRTKLGVVRPASRQVTDEEISIEKRWWGALDVVVTSASPYTQPEVMAKEWHRAGQELKQSHVDLIFLNCMGMDEEMKAVIADATHKPVVLASSIVARVIDELIGNRGMNDWGRTYQTSSKVSEV